jgi:hypothetical protein
MATPMCTPSAPGWWFSKSLQPDLRAIVTGTRTPPRSVTWGARRFRAFTPRSHRTPDQGPEDLIGQSTRSKLLRWFELTYLLVVGAYVRSIFVYAHTWTWILLKNPGLFLREGGMVMRAEHGTTARTNSKRRHPDEAPCSVMAL